MTTLGVVGQRWRATLTPFGAVVPRDGSTTLGWYVAADDRWYVPAREASLRQRSIGGTPVIETRLRVAGGDVVQRVFSVADLGGATVLEVANETRAAVVVAFDRDDLLIPASATPTQPRGIDLGPQAIAFALAHGATLRVALHHELPARRPLAALASAEQVVNGWTALCARASRFELPGGERGAVLAERVIAQRCRLAIDGTSDEPAADPVRWLAEAGDRFRVTGDLPDMLAVAAAVETIGGRAGWAVDVAHDQARRMLLAAGEEGAVADLDRIGAGFPASAPPPAAPDESLLAAWVESLIAHRGALFPNGVPDAWRGQSFEAQGIPTSPRSAVSLAVRWHGERPALLWEQSGQPLELTAPAVASGWSSSAMAGETLWPAEC